MMKATDKIVKDNFGKLASEKIGIETKSFTTKDGVSMDNIAIHYNDGKINQTISMNVNKDGDVSHVQAGYMRFKDNTFVAISKEKIVPELKEAWNTAWKLSGLATSKAFETYMDVKNFVAENSPKIPATGENRYVLSAFGLDSKNAFYINSVDDNSLKIFLDNDGKVDPSRIEYWKKDDGGDKRTKMSLDDITDKSLAKLKDSIIENYGAEVDKDLDEEVEMEM